MGCKWGESIVFYVSLLSLIFKPIIVSILYMNGWGHLPYKKNLILDFRRESLS